MQWANLDDRARDYRSVCSNVPWSGAITVRPSRLDIRRDPPRLVGNKPWARGVLTAECQETTMRLSLFILGVFAAVICIEKPAAAQGGGWCAYYNEAFGGSKNCGL